MATGALNLGGGTEKPGAGILGQTHRHMLREEIWGDLGCAIEDPELVTVAKAHS